MSLQDAGCSCKSFVDVSQLWLIGADRLGGMVDDLNWCRAEGFSKEIEK